MMKKFYFSLGKWFISAGVVLLPAWALANTNEIQMESYFPTPYVTYNNVFVSQQFDVGTSKGPFTLFLGSNRGNITPSLQIDPIPFGNILGPDGTANAFAFLKTTSEGGPILSFGNVQIRSSAVRFGSPTDQVDNAELTFGNLRIATLSNMKTQPVQEINATSVQVDEQMYLMEDKFTTQAGAALPGCEKTVSWKKLALGNEWDAWYLVCGDPVEGGDTPSCPSGKYVWQEDTALISCSLRSADDVGDYCNTIRGGMDLDAIKHILSISDCDATGTANFFGVRSKVLGDTGDTGIEKPTDAGQVYWLYDTQQGINPCSDAPADRPATFSWSEDINWNDANLVNTGYLQWTAEKGVVRAESFCE